MHHPLSERAQGILCAKAENLLSPVELPLSGRLFGAVPTSEIEVIGAARARKKVMKVADAGIDPTGQLAK
jgi:hypothetical protein